MPMCGRCYRRSDKQELAERVRAGVIDPEVPDLLQHYNMAPTTFQPVVRHTRDGGLRELLLMRWGLVPFFAKSLDAFKGFSTFNAKAEDITTKPTWKGPMERGRRCLVPADGFYEWDTLDTDAKKPDKQPYAFTVHPVPPSDPQPRTFAFAGLWDAWHNRADDTWLQSFTILTTGPNDLTAEVHTRMPVILHEPDWTG